MAGIAREALGAQFVADNRCRVGRLGTAEDLVPPCVVVVGVRVDDEQPLRIARPNAMLRYALSPQHFRFVSGRRAEACHQRRNARR